LKELKKEVVNYKPDVYSLFGKKVKSPRTIELYGDEVLNYKGQKRVPKEWLPFLSLLRTKLELYTKQYYSSALVNYYETGNNHISPHQDKEKYMTYETIIASVSLGVAREFVLMHSITKKKNFCTVAASLFITDQRKSKFSVLSFY